MELFTTASYFDRKIKRVILLLAMGAASAQALEAADVALMSNNLMKLPVIIHHSRRTLSIIRQNIFFSIGIKIVFLALAIPGLATLWMAVFANMGASLLVTMNGMRLLRMSDTVEE